MPRRAKVKKTAKSKAQVSQKKKTDAASKVKALQARIAKMQVNTSPFETSGAILGRGLGGMFGRPTLGGNIGGWLGSGIGKIFGSGAYKMSRNSVWNTAEQCPSMHSNSENIIVRHREYICDINSTTSFTNLEFPINPGLSNLFPFLSTIAANFQEYAFKGLVFEFRSTSADALNSTNTALGTVAMAIQYRAGASSFTNKQQVLNEMWAADSKPSENFYMPVECAPAECPMDIQYIRTGAVPSGEDIRFYDLGKLSVSTVGSQAVAVVGELWATYEVALKKPILSGAIGSNLETAALVRSSISGPFPLGTVSYSSVNNSIGATIAGAATQFVLPSQISGKYYVSFFWYGASGTWTLPSVTLSGGSYVNYNGFPTQVTSGTGVSAMAYQAIINIPDNNVPCILTFGSGGAYVGAPTLDITVAAMDFDTTST